MRLLAALALCWAGTSAPAGAAEKPEKEKLVCRTVKETGTRQGRRLCLPASEWARMGKDGQSAMDQFLGRQWSPKGQ